MGRLLLRNALLLDPERPVPDAGALLIEAGRIAARLGPEERGPEDARSLDLESRGLAPGFLDLHYHGSFVFHDAADFEASLAAAAASLVRHGTTAFLATTVAWPAPELAARVSRLAAILAEGLPAGALAIGLHLEGPWISQVAAGAQPLAAIRDFDPREGEEILARGGGCVRMVTLAPEIPGAEQLLARLTRRGVVAALGHSAASAVQAEGAVERGASHVTHLFNAMGRLHQREPGLAGAALADERLSCDLICDGVHIDPRLAKLAARAKGDRLTLITDRVEPPDSPAASFGSGVLRDDGAAWRLPDGRLAGSLLTMDRALRNARELAGMTQLEAIAACTVRPARVLGMESERGTLRPGARADLVVMDASGAVLETWIAGRRVFVAPGADPHSGMGGSRRTAPTRA